MESTEKGTTEAEEELRRCPGMENKGPEPGQQSQNHGGEDSLGSALQRKARLCKKDCVPLELRSTL